MMNFQSHSQGGQDAWVFEMTDHKTGGSFLDLGCSDAIFHNNTYALEEDWLWRGVLCDVVGGCESRKGVFIKCDAAKPNDDLKYRYAQLAPVCDYLSLDCDENTLPVFRALPWDTLSFRVATIETDVYHKGPDVRNLIRAAMREKGYALVCGDVKVEWPNAADRSVWEDWWAHPDLVNPELIEKYRCDGLFWQDILKR